MSDYEMFNSSKKFNYVQTFSDKRRKGFNINILDFITIIAFN